MKSTTKINANRENSKKSTGPKNTGRTRFNALKHGLTAQHVVIPSGVAKENADEYERFRRHFWDDMKPVGAREETLADSVVGLAWRLRRSPRFEAGLFAKCDVARQEFYRKLEKGAAFTISNLDLDSSSADLEQSSVGVRHLRELLRQATSDLNKYVRRDLRRYFAHVKPLLDILGSSVTDELWDTGDYAHRRKKLEDWMRTYSAHLEQKEIQIMEAERLELQILLAEQGLPSSESLERLARHEGPKQRELRQLLLLFSELQDQRERKEHSRGMQMDMNGKGNGIKDN
jgi:hypothetical protein